MIDLGEIIYKCPRCSYFREKTAHDFGLECPIHGLHLRKIGTLGALKKYYEEYRP
jgi:uncharacterized C2H2 Zn-finger protein